MRKLALAAALATTAMASPALARDDAWYIGVDGGAMLVEDLDFTTPTTALGNSSGTVDYNTGYDVDGVIGYDFGMFRLETEVGFRRAWTDQADFANGAPSSTKGNVRSLSFMLNGLLDFGPDDGLQGFVGGGVGIARTHLYNSVVDDSDTGFAWQVLAGVRMPLTDRIDASLKYRFFNHQNLDMVTSSRLNYSPWAGSGTPVDADLRTHSLLVGLSYNFGEPAAAPPPPPPPLPHWPPPLLHHAGWQAPSCCAAAPC
ncbi:MAG: porin family protein [Sphingomonadales bacterium]|nr:MAG: porin family protein [Sphingomonadales bacterium]